jgi:drug/metabolite transporter (DMT)-like permease
MFAKEAVGRGCRPVTNTVTSNFCLAVVWGSVGAVRGEFLPPAAWPAAAGIASLFVIGQLCTYLAFHYGDVSLATPVFGVKIILVAAISSALADTPIGAPIWMAAFLAAAGVGIIQAGGGPASETVSRKRAVAAIGLALVAAAALSLFDIALQVYGRRLGAGPFLSTMFVWMGLLSCGLLPWADRPSRLRELNAMGPLVVASLLMAGQAVSISFALGRFGDATRVNIVYALRGLWSVLLAWWLGRLARSPEGRHSARTLAFRLTGAVLLMIAVLVALG